MVQKNQMQHLLSIKSLNRDLIEEVLARADYLRHNVIPQNRSIDSLKGKIVANLFFEPSTRTRNSFIIAAKRSNAVLTLNPHLSHSALLKGESLLDTIWTFEAMGVSYFIIRHAENGIPDWMAQNLKTAAHVINAGDGTHEHPTQTLIDLLTIQQHKKPWQSLTVAIIGDIIHSRVAQSLIAGLTMMGVAKIHLVAPPNLLPDHTQISNSATFNSLEEGIKDVDVIVTLRLQKERAAQPGMPAFTSFHKSFCLTPKKLALAKPDAIVMHPGPMNRDVEIASAVADSAQSVILQQVSNGIAIRMAVFDLL